MPSRNGRSAAVSLAALLLGVTLAAAGCEMEDGGAAPGEFEPAETATEAPAQAAEPPVEEEPAEAAAEEEPPATAAPPATQPPLRPSAPGQGLLNAWATLQQGADEPDGFGMYSYLVFAGPPTEATRDRYVAALRAVLEYDPVAEALVYADRSSINLTFIPVRGAVTHQPESLLEAYDYARARAVLRQVDVPGGRGPYLLSSTAPLDPRDPAGGDAPVLWQDLSTVPPELVRLWVREYMAQAVSEDGYQGEAGARWVVRLRTGIEQVATAWPVVSDSLDSLVQWVGRIRGEGP